MPFNGINELCLPLQIGDGDHCIVMPGGTELCVNFPSIIPPTNVELMQQLFAQINSALTPLQPTFNIVDAIVAIFRCVKAIATLNPVEIVACIPNLADKVTKLLQLVPIVSVPKMIVDIVDCLILFLEGLQQQLLAQQGFMNRLLTAELVAAEPGNIGIKIAIDCARAQVDAQIDYMNESAKPINRLIGLVNFFLETIGLKKQCIPSIGSISSSFIDEYLTLLQVIIDFLRLLRGFIPVPALPALNSKSCA